MMLKLKPVKTVTLSVKNVPLKVAQGLRERAERNHRSLQGELLSILHDTSRVVTVDDLMATVRRLGLETPSESAAMIREDRDARSR